MLLSHLNPDPYQHLIDALEEARIKICTYLGPTCDCKWGLVPSAELYTKSGATVCSHNRMCEHTGCPELRQMIGAVRWGQRRRWAALAEQHMATPTHYMPCCDRVLLVDPPASGSCGGPDYCAVCVTEAEQIHKPPAEQP